MEWCFFPLAISKCPLTVFSRCAIENNLQIFEMNKNECKLTLKIAQNLFFFVENGSNVVLGTRHIAIIN